MIISLPETPRLKYDFLCPFYLLFPVKMIYQNMQPSSTEECCGPIMFVPKDHMLKLYFLGVTRFGDGH